MSRVDQIVQYIREQIQSGGYQSQQRLLSIRAGAVHFQVSKNTMAEAYERLVAEGLLYARQGSGYYVAETLSVTEPPRRAHIAQAVDTVSLLRKQLEPDFDIRVGDGRLPPSWASKDISRQLLRSLAKSENIEQGYGNPWGYNPLRERLCLSLAERGVVADLDQLLLTHGANHALDLVSRYLLEPGDTVIVESPGYYPLFGKLQYLNIKMLSVPREAQGPNVEVLASLVKKHRPKLLFTQTLAHNPTGGNTSIPNQYRILSLAEQYDFYVVEDDPFADLLPPETPRLATLDQLNRVIYVATFSKTMSAALRVGYLAANPMISRAICDLKMLTLVSTSDFAERAVLSFINNGHYLRHLRRLRIRVQDAKERVEGKLKQYKLRVFSPSQGGFYLWVELPAFVTEKKLCEMATEAGVFVAPGSLFRVERHTTPTAMRVNIAHAMDPRFWSFLNVVLGESPVKHN